MKYIIYRDDSAAPDAVGDAIVSNNGVRSA